MGANVRTVVRDETQLAIPSTLCTQHIEIWHKIAHFTSCWLNLYAVDLDLLVYPGYGTTQFNFYSFVIML